MSVPKPGSNLFQNTQSLDGSSSNLDKANGANRGRPTTPPHNANGTKYEANKLDNRATDVLLEQSEARKYSKTQNGQTVNNSECVSTSEELRDNSNMVKCKIFLTKISESEGLLMLKIGQNVFNAYVDADGKVIEKNFKVEFGNLIKQVLESEKDQIKSFLENKETKKSKSITIATYTTKDLVEMREVAEENLMPEGPTIAALPKTKVLSADQNLAVSFLSLIDKANSDSNIKLIKPRNAIEAAIRNFFFKIAMWIAAKWRGDGNMNSSVRSNARGVCEDLDLNLGKGAHVRINNATLIPTCRDGNCTLWAILKAVYGEEFVENNFEYCRNTLIPYFRRLIAEDLRLQANLSELNAQVDKMDVRYSDGADVLGVEAEKSLKGMSQEIERNCGFRASYIEPKLLGPVAQALGCDIAVITNNGSGTIMYLLTEDGNAKRNDNFTGEDSKRFAAALQNGHAIYGSNGHMWGLNTSGGVQYTYPAPEKSNTTNQGGTGNANNPSAKSQEDLMAGVKDLDDLSD